MILNKVVLNDFISHKNTTLAFGYGINVIIGPNGAGKTSILDAISFALFNDSSSRGKKENLINSKANKCKITLEFTEKGILYSIDWIFERGKSPKGFLYKVQGNEKKSLIAQGGEKTLIPEVERILEMDQSMFAQSIYVRQGEIEELVNAKPADRKNLISKLLGVESLQKAWTEMRIVVDEFESTSDQLKGELSQKATIENEKQTHLYVAGDSETAFRKKTAELREIENKIINLQSVLQGLKESKKTYDKLDKQKGLVETEIHASEEKLEKEQKELSHAMDAEAKVNSLKLEVEKLSFLEAYVSALTQKKQHDEQLRRLRDKIGTIDRLEQTIRENTEKHGVYLETDGAIRLKNTERKKFEGAETALEQTLLSIQQVEKDEKKKQGELAKELTKWTQILGETTTVANFETLLELKRGNFQSIAEKLGAQVDILGKNIGGLENRRKELADSISKLEESTVEVTSCPTCETELTAERLSQLLEKFHSQDKTAAKELEQLAKELKKVDENKKGAEDIFRKASKLDEQKIKGLCSELGEMKSRLEGEDKRVEELKKQAEALKNLDTAISSLEEGKSLVTEGYQEFESARRELAKLPPRDRISDEMAPVVTALAIVEQNMREAVSNMGYESEKPDKELASLRAKKQVFDQNIKLAGRRAEFEQSIKTIQTDFDSKRREFREIEASIKNLGYNEQEHGQKEADAENKNLQKSALKEAIAALDEKITHSKDEVTNCQRKLDTLKMKEKEKHSIDAFIQLLNRIRSAYSKDGVQKMIRGQARPMLERRTRDLFERFNLAYSDIRIDDDYNISVMGSSGEQDIDQISGGERVALAIALRLAIAQVLSEKVETIIMDEPTTHLDEERRRELVNILSSFFREEGRIIPQMLIITHHPEIENVADVIYTVTKENGYSQVQTGQTIDDS